ncbi:MAG: type II secretion system F family protein [Planctomycetota bacterium]
MILTYDAMDTKGHRTHDRIEAADRRDAVEQLRRRGLFVTEIAESSDGKKAANAATKPVTATRLPLRILTLFTRQMAMLLRAGSALVPAIQAVRRQMKNPRHAALLDRVVADLEEGTPLTDAMRKHPDSFDSVYCAIIAAGEASASLPQMFERLSKIVGNRRAMRNKILGALAYPVLLIAMCAKIILVLLFFVLPRFADMFKQLGVQTPAVTRALLAVGAAMRDHWILVVIATLSLVAGAVWLFKSATGRRWITDVQIYLPILGRLRCRLIQAQVLRTMGMLIESRVGVLEALELARSSTRNRKFQQLFTALEDAVTSGSELSGSFAASPLIEPYVAQAVKTGEDCGNLGEAMTYSADMLDETNTELVQVVARLIEPTVLITMGVVVGGVAISLFLPLFDLTSAMR